jgi:hypothetical protein
MVDSSGFQLSRIPIFRRGMIYHAPDGVVQAATNRYNFRQNQLSCRSIPNLDKYQV